MELLSWLINVKPKSCALVVKSRLLNEGERGGVNEPPMQLVRHSKSNLIPINLGLEYLLLRSLVNSAHALCWVVR